MSQVEPIHDEYFDILKKSYERLTNDFISLSQEKNNLQNKLKAQGQRANIQLNEQKAYYQSVNNEQIKKIAQLEANCKNLQQEEIIQTKKEFRKYIEGINQKQIQITNLKRQIHTQKNRIASLQQEVNNLSNIKQNYQIFVLKTSDQIKNNVKEAFTYIEDIQNEKMVMQSKFRQMNQKIILIQNQLFQIQGQKNIAEDNYNKLKQLYKNSKDQYLQCKYELQKNKQFTRSHITFIEKEQSENETQIMIMKQFQNMVDLKNLLVEYEKCLRQTNEFSTINKQILEQNVSLKLRISDLINQIDQLKLNSFTEQKDNILKQNEPSLFQYLAQKKQQLKEFQRQIQKIEAYMEDKDQSINGILNSFTEQGLQCNCGKQKLFDEVTYKYEQLKKRYDFIVELNQKKRDQNAKYEAKLNEFQIQIKELFEFKRKKLKSTNINNRCCHCFITLQKSTPYSQCSDCKMRYHEFYCMDNHNCQLYNLDDNGSNYSSSRKKK